VQDLKLYTSNSCNILKGRKVDFEEEGKIQRTQNVEMIGVVPYFDYMGKP
jgi:hypothetical protein